MRKVFYIFLLILICACPVQVSAEEWDHPDPIYLSFPNTEQQNKYWCWAALAQQIIGSRIGRGIPDQCRLVTMANEAAGLPGVNCCGDPNNRACSRLADSYEVAGLISRYGGQGRMVPVPRTPDDLYEYLISGQGLVAVVTLPEGYNHAYLVRGMSWSASGAMVTINDPAVGRSINMPFNEAQASWRQTMAVE